MILEITYLCCIFSESSNVLLQASCKILPTDSHCVKITCIKSTRVVKEFTTSKYLENSDIQSYMLTIQKSIFRDSLRSEMILNLEIAARGRNYMAVKQLCVIFSNITVQQHIDVIRNQNWDIRQYKLESVDDGRKEEHMQNLYTSFPVYFKNPTFLHTP